MLADNLKTILEIRKISMYKLSKDTGIPHTTIRDIVSGKSKNPSYNLISAIAKALNIPISELTGNDESKLQGAYIEVAKVAQDKKIDPAKILAIIDLIENGGLK